jgi:hypothetical protein
VPIRFTPVAYTAVPDLTGDLQADDVQGTDGPAQGRLRRSSSSGAH